MNRRYHEILAQSLTEAIKRRGVGKSELCRRAGISRPTLDAYLEGKGAPGLDTITALADTLGTTPSRLLAGPDDRPSPWDAFDEVTRLLKEVRERGVDSPEIRAMFGFPPKK